MPFRNEIGYQVQGATTRLTLDGMDYEQPEEFLLLKRLLQEFAEGHVCYADAPSCNPEDLFPGLVQRHKSTRPPWTIDILGIHIAPGTNDVFDLGALDAMKLRTEIFENRFTNLFFCRPEFTWEDFLGTDSRGESLRMAEPDPVCAEFFTANWGEYIRVLAKPMFDPAIQRFLEEARQMGFVVKA